MKIILTLCVGLISTSLFAQDFLDLNFFSAKNEFQLDTLYSESRVDFRTHDATGPISSLEKVKAGIFSNKLTYGLTQKSRIGLALDAALKGEINNTNYYGSSDLRIVGEHRLFSDGEYFIDANAGYQLSTEKKTNTNYRTGHDVINLGASMGQKKNSHEWRMTGDLKYHAWGKNNGEITTPHADFDLEAKYQYTGIDKFAFGIGMDWKYLAEKTLKYSNGSNSVTDTDSILGFNIFGKYALSDSVYLEAGYGIHMRYELDSELANNKTTDKYREGSTCFLGARFMF